MCIYFWIIYTYVIHKMYYVITCNHMFHPVYSCSIHIIVYPVGDIHGYLIHLPRVNNKLLLKMVIEIPLIYILCMVIFPISTTMFPIK